MLITALAAGMCLHADWRATSIPSLQVEAVPAILAEVEKLTTVRLVSLELAQGILTDDAVHMPAGTTSATLTLSGALSGSLPNEWSKYVNLTSLTLNITAPGLRGEDRLCMRVT
jgi:hypothetical protein